MAAAEFAAMRRKARKGDIAVFNRNAHLIACAYEDTDAAAFFHFVAAAFEALDDADRAFMSRRIDCSETLVAWRFPSVFVEELAGMTPNTMEALADRCRIAGFGGADVELSKLIGLSRRAVDETKAVYAFCDTA